MITIDHLLLPAPSACTVEISAGAGTEKVNTLGYTVFDGRKEKRRLTLSWVRMEASVMAELFSLLDALPVFTVTYPDPVSGQKSLLCHARERSARVRQYREQAAWADVYLKLEEQ